MGAGRKTETYTISNDGSYWTGSKSLGARNLQKGDLCGVILGCTDDTINECYAKMLFGLPAHHMSYIQHIDPGLPLFLFNYKGRKLHGIFEAASKGKLNIDPKAWSTNGIDPTPYPAQVKVRVRVQCEPLPEKKFRTLIKENYYHEDLFSFELDRDQTNKLLRLFSRFPSLKSPSASRKGIPPSSLAEIGGGKRIDKWSSLFKSSDDSSQACSSYSSVPRNITDSSNLENKTFWISEVSSQAGKGAENSWESTSQIPSLHQTSKGFRNGFNESEDLKKSFKVNSYQATSATAYQLPSFLSEDTYSEIDLDMTSLKTQLDELYEGPRYEDGFNKPSSEDWNKEPVSSSMLSTRDDVKESWDFEEGNNDKSNSGSSFVSAITGDVADDSGYNKDKPRTALEFSNSEDMLIQIFSELRELKQSHTKQDERITSLEIELIESRKEIYRLKGKYTSS